ncbi:MAG: FAD-binding oxidoreductase [Anaerolineae bacterium]|nr:FAD-binding oxidoreductase [Anaerolineae bacterium]
MKSLSEQIRDGVQGEVCDGSAAPFYARDFGRQAYTLPQVVVKATCEADIRHCLQVANSQRIPITVRGGGHSSNGQSLCENGILIVNLAEQAQYKLLDDHRVEVSARTLWGQLEIALNRHGRAFPIHTDYLNLSVGGTLSVGGIGVRSLVHGLQIDQVEKLRLILPDGSVRWCSPEENANLFRFSLAGLGQVGIIETAVLRTIPYRKQSRIYMYGHRNLTALAESIAWMQERKRPLPDFFHAVRMHGQVTSVFGLDDDDKSQEKWKPEAYPEFLLGVQPVADFPFWSHAIQEQWLQEQPNHMRIWSDYFFDFEGFVDFLAFLDTLVRDRRVSPYIWAIYVLMIRSTEESGQFPFSPAAFQPAPPLVYSVGVYGSVSEIDMEGKAMTKDICPRIQEKAFALHGRPYLHGSYQLNRESLLALYGREYETFLALKRQVDPSSLLNANIHLHRAGLLPA